MTFIFNMDYKLICILVSYILLPSFFVEATEFFPRSTSRNRETVLSGGSANRPAPVDCKMKPWSQWSACDPCTSRKHRFRYLETPSQFGGTPCRETQWDADVCRKATLQCLMTNFCEEPSFTCKMSGRCIERELVCNGDRDCGDWSDEDGCESKTREDKCSSLSPVPGVSDTTQGFNVLTGDFVDHVLDYDYYGGLCEYVYNGEWKKLTYDAFCESLRYLDDEKNYRKPYNYLTYRFMAQATSEGATEYYEDLSKFLRARQEESSLNFGMSMGVGYTAGSSGSNEEKFLTKVTQYASQDLGFVRLVSRVQTAQFKMRSGGLVLTEQMYEDLMDLPEQYDFGRYSTFLNSYGTHYLTKGTLGGTLEYVAVVNKTAMSASDHSVSEIGLCIGRSVGLSAPISETVSAGLKVEGEVCIKNKDSTTGKTSSHSYIKDIITQVKGGTTGSSGRVMVVQDPDSYRKWGATLKYNPTIIDAETMPIFELVRQSTAADPAGPRLAHLRRSWDEYQLEFNSCRCAPCRHGGVPVLGQSDCRCVCKEGFHGDACQETLRKGSTTDGAWSCWGAWTSCQSGRRSRTRSCSNPPPDGGVACLGSSSQTQQHC